MGLIPNPLHHPNCNRHRLFLDNAQFLAYIEPQNLLSVKIHGEYGKNFSAITLNQEITEFQNSSDHLYKANTLVLVGLGSNDIYSNNLLKRPSPMDQHMNIHYGKSNKKTLSHGL